VDSHFDVAFEHVVSLGQPLSPCAGTHDFATSRYTAQAPSCVIAPLSSAVRPTQSNPSWQASNERQGDAAATRAAQMLFAVDELQKRSGEQSLPNRVKLHGSPIAPRTAQLPGFDGVTPRQPSPVWQNGPSFPQVSPTALRATHRLVPDAQNASGAHGAVDEQALPGFVNAVQLPEHPSREFAPRAQ
jgi:hypothetical protein